MEATTQYDGIQEEMQSQVQTHSVMGEFSFGNSTIMKSLGVYVDHITEYNLYSNRYFNLKVLPDEVFGLLWDWLCLPNPTLQQLNPAAQEELL